MFKKEILLADLNYAHETLGAYNRALFFDPQDPAKLAEAMKSVIYKTVVFQELTSPALPEPFTRNWKELFNVLLSK